MAALTLDQRIFAPFRQQGRFKILDISNLNPRDFVEMACTNDVCRYDSGKRVVVQVPGFVLDKDGRVKDKYLNMELSTGVYLSPSGNPFCWLPCANEYVQD